MRIIKYGTRLGEERRNILVKEQATNYQCEPLNNPESVVRMLNEVFSLHSQAEEYVYMVAVDIKGKPIGVFEVSHGTVSTSILEPREIFIRALLVGAVSIFIAHNHPSGDCKPSREDCLITRRIEEAGKLLNVRLLDHIVIGNRKYHSFKENSLID